MTSRSDGHDVDESEHYYGVAMALAEVLGMRPLLAHCHLGLGRLYRRTERGEEARTQLARARELFRSMQFQYETSLLYRDQLSPLADQGFQVALVAYQSGKIDFTTLAASLQREYGARINYLQAANQFFAGRVALEQTVGAPLTQ